jgi:hypothetical protein
MVARIYCSTALFGTMCLDKPSPAVTLLNDKDSSCLERLLIALNSVAMWHLSLHQEHFSVFLLAYSVLHCPYCVQYMFSSTTVGENLWCSNSLVLYGYGHTYRIEFNLVEETDLSLSHKILARFCLCHTL